MTLKAVRALGEADVVAYFAKLGNGSHARATACAHFRVGAQELALGYPVTTEAHRHDDAYRAAITGFYDDSARAVAAHLDAGRTVAVLSEGDPLFYGSYMHLHVRLAARYAAEVIPGVTGMSGCWSQAGTPIAQGDDVLCVLPGTLDEDELARRLARGRCRDHHEGRPQPAEDPPRAGERRAAGARALCRARHHGRRALAAACRARRGGAGALFRHRAGAGLGGAVDERATGRRRARAGG